MAQGGSFDFKGMQDLLARVEKAAAQSERFQRELLQELGNRALHKVQRRTPKVTGNLRRNWAISAVERKGDSFEITVYNPTEYASYVEYGHRQKVGQKGVASGKPWVEGLYMLTISTKEIEGILPGLTAKRAEEFLRGMMGER